MYFNDMYALQEHMAVVQSVVAKELDIYRDLDLLVAHGKYHNKREIFLAVVTHLRASLNELEITPADTETTSTPEHIINT